ncbi:MAG TPA: hypothetical protein VK638_30370 [Edaphobacter sp.]|nr:hypothetical protein [Edaphobacter sp.]
MSHDPVVEAIKNTIREHEKAIARLKEMLRIHDSGVGVLTVDGHLKRKPKTWKAADDLERILDFGKNTMKRAELVEGMVKDKRIGSSDDAERAKNATEAIRRGLVAGYLKENPDTILHWIPM